MGLLRNFKLLNIYFLTVSSLYSKLHWLPVTEPYAITTTKINNKHVWILFYPRPWVLHFKEIMPSHPYTDQMKLMSSFPYYRK